VLFWEYFEALAQRRLMAYCVEKLGFSLTPISGEGALRSFIPPMNHARIY
jgi:hypothetical protein